MARPFANPVAFTPWPVTILTTAIYLALTIPLLVIHNVVPSAPRTNPSGLDLDEAWSDLQVLTSEYHPYNSHQNDKVHEWLLKRVHELSHAPRDEDGAKPDVYIFDDTQTNLTYSRGLEPGNAAVYFEGTNIIVYIRGEEDDPTNWWEDDPVREPASKGVLVNAHYDSVSTGFGATDDGMGVVTCLQLIRYFTSPGRAPRKGLVVLFNNGEEDFLNGAVAYGQHPMARFTKTFLNLEGAGAGGRATLFRTSDTAVTRAYLNAEHPFGSVMSADGFEAGLIRSQTDYVVFEKLGMRGLDVAFLEPRARYHTDRDDARHASLDSLWHMLESAVATTEGLVSAGVGRQTRSVWFDLFGSTFVVFRLHTLFAVSVTLLIVAPLTLLFTSIALSRADKMYLFRSSVKLEDEKVELRGLRGFFRFPFLFVIPTAVTMCLAYLLTKVNPYIIHSSEYAVWAMMISAWTFLAWFVSRVADFARPSAFHRVYTLTWMFALAWVLQVIATVYEDRFGMAGGYFIFFDYVGTSLATWVAYLELFALPRKSDYAAQFINPESRRASSARHSEPDDEEEEPTESTSLLHDNQRTTFAHYHITEPAGDEVDTDNTSDTSDPHIYAHEQRWSSHLPKWTWILQFLLLAPIVLILAGPLALLGTGAIHQTAQDGSSSLFIYLFTAGFTTFLLTPLLPFIHRHTAHIPIFLLFVLAGTLVYNLTAFPFSESNRLKLYFVQEVDLDGGNGSGGNTVSLSGIPPYVQQVISSLPNAPDPGNFVCDDDRGKLACKYPGLAARVAPGEEEEWMSFDIEKRNTDTSTVEKGNSQATISITPQNSRACKLDFASPISNFSILQSTSSSSPSTASSSSSFTPEDNGEEITTLTLWSRTWTPTFRVRLTWPRTDDSRSPLQGKVTCLWSDDNEKGLIPSLDEIRQYAPVWAGVSKARDGLVEGSKGFEIY